MRLNVTEDATVTPGGVTFSPPVATTGTRALDPRGPADNAPPADEAPPATVEDAPLYVVVMQGGVEVLYKRVGD